MERKKKSGHTKAIRIIITTQVLRSTYDEGHRPPARQTDKYRSLIFYVVIISIAECDLYYYPNRLSLAPNGKKKLVVVGILSIAPVIRADDACRHRVSLDTTNRLDYVNRHDRRYVYLQVHRKPSRELPGQ